MGFRFVKRLLIFFLVINSLLSHSQCFDKNEAFKPGEKLNYEVYYNWGFIWVNAGEVLFEVREAKFDQIPSYHFYSFGKSKPNYDWIFTVRDTYQSWVDISTLKPLKFEREVHEGSFKAKDVYAFDPDNNEVFTNVKNTSYSKKDTLAIKDCTLDVLSMIYFTRNVNFSKLTAGQKVPISMLIEDKEYDLFIRFRGKEQVELKDGRTFNCAKFSVLLVEGTLFSDGEDMTVWVTDDNNKIPVLVEAKILVGSVKAYLSTHEGLRHPVTAQTNSTKNK